MDEGPAMVQDERGPMGKAVWKEGLREENRVETD